jgi:hypothetical protein
MLPLWRRSVSIRRSEIEFVAADRDSSQPGVGGQKSEPRITAEDAEYGFHTSQEMSIRRSESLFVASGVTLFRCDERSQLRGPILQDFSAIGEGSWTEMTVEWGVLCVHLRPLCPYVFILLCKDETYWRNP